MPNQTKFAQHFTPESVAKLMASLCKYKGTFLDPCCGRGILTETLVDDGHRGAREGYSIELDPTIAPHYALVQDFMEFDLKFKVNSVICNPPYLSHKSIPESTRSLSMFRQLQAKLGGLSNLYAAFILKSYLHLEPHGELVFVVPEECFRTTSNFKLMSFLHTNGTFTDIIRYVKSPFLPAVSQPVVVFRYQKGDMSHRTNVRIEE